MGAEKSGFRAGLKNRANFQYVESSSFSLTDDDVVRGDFNARPKFRVERGATKKKEKNLNFSCIRDFVLSPAIIFTLTLSKVEKINNSRVLFN